MKDGYHVNCTVSSNFLLDKGRVAENLQKECLCYFIILKEIFIILYQKRYSIYNSNISNCNICFQYRYLKYISIIYTFYRILSGFHRTFATGVACRQGTLTPPDTSSRPFGTCKCSTCCDQSFFRTCHYFSGLCSSNIPLYFFDFA